MRRGPTAFTIAAIPLLTALLANLATSTLPVTGIGVPLVWLGTATVALTSILIEVRRALTGPTSNEDEPEHDGELIKDAIKRLAAKVRQDWEREEERRNIHDPYALKVRWHNASPDIMDHRINIWGDGWDLSDAGIELSGELTGVAATFGSLPRRRLVVLGKAGSGKTVLTLRLTLDLIKHHSDDDPVPVIFELSSWNPESTPLAAWLTGQLLEEYSFLASRLRSGPTLAEVLVDRGKIIPILDGLDEIAQRLRGPALAALSATESPMLLTSRTDEYALAVDDGDVLTKAAVVVLDDLSIEDVAKYLHRATRLSADGSGSWATKWDPVITHLRQKPTAPESTLVLAVLSSPLMLSLARLIYSDSRLADPHELLNATRFPDAMSLEEHLLDQFIPAAYRQQTGRWKQDDALYWHRRLATILHRLGTRDIAWWQLGNVVPTHARMTIGVAAGAMGAGALLFLAWQFGVGLGIGFGGGVAIDNSPPPRRTPFSLHGRAGNVFRLAACYIFGGFTSATALSILRTSDTGYVVSYLSESTSRAFSSAEGLVVGVAACAGGIVTAAASIFLGRKRRESVSTDGEAQSRPLREFIEMAIYGFVIGLLGTVTLGYIGGLAMTTTFALALGIVVTLEKPIDVQTRNGPRDLLRTDRANALFLLAIFAIAIGLPAGIVLGGELSPMVGVLVSAGGGMTIGLGIMLGYTAWGRWILVTRLWLPLTGRLPWALFQFLRDAHRVGVFRQVGGVYQFRHARLQDRLRDLGR